MMMALMQHLMRRMMTSTIGRQASAAKPIERRCRDFAEVGSAVRPQRRSRSAVVRPQRRSRSAVVRPQRRSRSTAPLVAGRPRGVTFATLPLICYIDGNIGSGKSTVIRELRRVGYVAREEPIGAWKNALGRYYAALGPQGAVEGPDGRSASPLGSLRPRSNDSERSANAAFSLDALIARTKRQQLDDVLDITRRWTPTSTGDSSRDRPSGISGEALSGEADRPSGLSSEALSGEADRLHRGPDHPGRIAAARFDGDCCRETTDRAAVSPVFIERSPQSDWYFVEVRRSLALVSNERYAELEKMYEKNKYEGDVARVYLRVDAIECKARVDERARANECDRVTLDYLRAIERAHDDGAYDLVVDATQVASGTCAEDTRDVVARILQFASRRAVE
jgi:hypothetical protein